MLILLQSIYHFKESKKHKKQLCDAYTAVTGIPHDEVKDIIMQDFKVYHLRHQYTCNFFPGKFYFITGFAFSLFTLSYCQMGNLGLIKA